MLSPFRGIPSASASFFWNSMMISACWSRLDSFWFCRFNCSLSATSWLCGLGLRPRVLGVKPVRIPCWRWWRHRARLEEYSPSRRNKAPSLPALLASVGLVQDLELVVHREATATGFGHHFRIGCHDQGGPGGLSQRRHGGSPYGSRGLATLAHAHLRGWHHGNNFLLEETRCAYAVEFQECSSQREV